MPNPDQHDANHNGIGDACDPDMDGDGIPNEKDNCPLVANTDQSDIDHDGKGDVCDPDIDGDKIPNEKDAFPFDPKEWDDKNHNGIGDNADKKQKAAKKTGAVKK
ncbi:MAG TPA: thrombospondin type 3 repeat-containing protein [Pseudomonadales bacterium]|nr:thrombospondin type 3 repeat-containing protein [Pseudomonadales bacterium]